ncbi:MAG: outer membrane lipid asymmetry maintenance protein MlaD [Nevskiaceae bacterium]|jgi:phospholipid/cholesterol/gamma-HCH transport system substrate-binding protein|nr:outer membrane lipid asymmetry maintenance protein MlaD [Nevskiaceae bacterium]
MSKSRGTEIGTGLFVLLGFAALVFLTTQLPGSKLGVLANSGGYQVSARFENVGDLQAGAPVTMSGVKVGRVTGVSFDSTDYKAVVTMAIDPRYDRIPDDSWANIETAGLLGAKYVGLDAGGSETYLADKGQIDNTQSAMVLEKLVNRLFAAFAGGGGNSNSKEDSQ